MSATALNRDPHTGKFVAHRTTCAGCGWVYAESLMGDLYCANTNCNHYRTTAGKAPGVDPGVLTSDVLVVR